MKIVALDAGTLGSDLDLSPLSAVGELTTYEASAPDAIALRALGADVLVINKVKINQNTLGASPTVRLICIAATGYDNIDLTYCRAHGICVANVAGYSTNSVAQVTIAMALSLYTHLPQFSDHVKSGAYSAGGAANCLTPFYREIAGKTWGIIGYGHIGQAVGRIAQALGCRLLVCKRTPVDGVMCVDVDTVCREADIISIHTPLNDATRGLINADRLAKMKKGAVLINAARGAVTDESAVAKAVLQGQLGGLGVDVYSAEPFPQGHPFDAIKDLPNVCLTPHMAWGAYEARVRCLDEIVQNIKAFTQGERRSRVD